jgi:putative FmdB family regulatory protein
MEDLVPTYQYACTECHHAFEQFQSFSDDALTVCPQCQGRLRKVFNAVGVVFKGSGFYRTDSRSDARSKESGGSEDKPAAAKTGDAGSGSTGESSTPAKTDKASTKSDSTTTSTSGTTGSSSAA